MYGSGLTSHHDASEQGSNFSLLRSEEGQNKYLYFYKYKYSKQPAQRRPHGPKAHRYLVLYHIPMMQLGGTKMQFQNGGGHVPPVPS